MQRGLFFDIQVPLPAFRLAVRAEVSPGVTAVVGPSGSGKTTLLRALAGLTVPADGIIQLNGRVLFSAKEGIHLPPERRRVGYVPQQYALFPRLRVIDNVMYGLKARGVPRRERRRRAMAMLERMGIAHLADRRPAQLSGGEAQRVALARALVVEPDVLLLDEPLSALDPETRRQLRSFLRTVLADAGCPVVCVTHDREDVATLADAVLVLKQGRVVAAGSPKDVMEKA
ncbi:ABC transporter ATP-binding protein [Alicyclobacillus macrosporangiidus]|uniref:Molybdate transport system ATP-binding protein n=1 Tax=Alicyclobacillus macrosporangiidus TaxID=392015 RepID=A0A1I7LAP8_9BACL|nr:ABC transporter ATP-binding protein [Alicyclobacillus macrosporangiidus]SFV06832.1 molybdate transport system ATP-binding protein [Alicyclobacillus macrosporangiidus]